MVAVPLVNTDSRDTMVMLVYQTGLGYRFFSWIAPIVEFRGQSPLSEAGDAVFWINAGTRLWIGEHVEATARISVPLNDRSQWSDAPVHWSLGASYIF